MRCKLHIPVIEGNERIKDKRYFPYHGALVTKMAAESNRRLYWLFEMEQGKDARHPDFAIIITNDRKANKAELISGIYTSETHNDTIYSSNIIFRRCDIKCDETEEGHNAVYEFMETIPKVFTIEEFKKQDQYSDILNIEKNLTVFPPEENQKSEE